MKVIFPLIYNHLIVNDLKSHFTYYSPIGPLCIESEEDMICAVNFCDKEINSDYFPSKLQKDITEQLDDYFEGNLFEFNLPINPEGTQFQRRVWDELLNIPYGKQTTYVDIATHLGDKNLVRAVGGANSKNPIAIIIPCHRVIGVNKNLIGYAGGLWRKKWLLQHELSNNPEQFTLW